MADRDKCRTCAYRSDNRYVNKCDYLLLTGHSRGCVGDEHCAHYQQGPRKRKSLAAIACLPALPPGDAEMLDYIKRSALQPNRRYSLEKSVSRTKNKIEGRR